MLEILLEQPEGCFTGSGPIIDFGVVSSGWRLSTSEILLAQPEGYATEGYATGGCAASRLCYGEPLGLGYLRTGAQRWRLQGDMVVL
jgi:hypothetical protein